MKIIVKNNSKENVPTLMRRLGYRFQYQDPQTQEMVFVCPIYGRPYPRFHVYLKENKNTGEIILNIHLDQKKPIYKGAPAHSADYDGEGIENEVRRIKNFFEQEI